MNYTLSKLKFFFKRLRKLKFKPQIGRQYLQYLRQTRDRYQVYIKKIYNLIIIKSVKIFYYHCPKENIKWPIHT